MKNFFENEISYRGISFSFTDKSEIDEREIHTYHEMLFYIDGEVELFTTGGSRALKKMSLLIIPEGSYHFLKRKNSSGFKRLKISFSSESVSDTPITRLVEEMKIIENPDSEIIRILSNLCDELANISLNSAFYAYSLFLALACELDKRAYEAAERVQAESDSLMTALSEYIAKNLSQRLDVETLARVIHVSPSGITHLFKKKFGISIHKYITQKRLVFSKKLLIQGANPTKVFAAVGFGDYSSYYKAYLKYFGYSPSREKAQNDNKH